MYEDLAVIAQLRFGKEAEAISNRMRNDLREEQAKYVALNPAPGMRSGHQEATVGRIKIEASAKLARAMFQIWVDLIRQRKNHIAREDIDFIVERVKQFADMQPQHILNSSSKADGGVTHLMVEEMKNRMYGVTAEARRDLEIMVREYEAFPAKRFGEKQEDMKHIQKKRFSVGRRVLVGIGMRPAMVVASEDKPSVLGEFSHEVRFDDGSVISALGCDIHPLPELDEDLRGNRPAIHIQNSNVANLNLGSQVGMITANLSAISRGQDTQPEFVKAIEQLTQAVISESALAETEKEEVVQAIASLSQEAAKNPQERSKGTLKALVSWIPSGISAANNLLTLWDKLGPIIKGYLGI